MWSILLNDITSPDLAGHAGLLSAMNPATAVDDMDSKTHESRDPLYHSPSIT